MSTVYTLQQQQHMLYGEEKMLNSIPWDGNPISIAGCYSGIGLETYHNASICNGPSISSTGLRTIYMLSPAHYWDSSPYNPNRAPPDFTKAEEEWKIIGRAASHLLVGGVGHFHKEYVIQPTIVPRKDPGDRLGWSEEHAEKKWHGGITWCKRWSIEKRTKGFTIITEDQIKIIQGMAVSLSINPYIRSGSLLDGLIERSLFWRDPETGVWLKSRPDVISTSSAEASDFKTTQSVLWHKLSRTIEDFGYHQQGALVGEGLKAVFDMNMTTFTDVFVEKKRPYCVRPAPINGDDLLRGRLQNRVAIRKFANYMEKTNSLTIHDNISAQAMWPGPDEDARDGEAATLSLGTAARERADKRLRFEGMLT